MAAFLRSLKSGVTLEIAEAIEYSETSIVMNQVKYHPYKSQAGLLAFCIDENVMLTAYSRLLLGMAAMTKRWQ